MSVFFQLASQHRYWPHEVRPNEDFSATVSRSRGRGHQSLQLSAASGRGQRLQCRGEAGLLRGHDSVTVITTDFSQLILSRFLASHRYQSAATHQPSEITSQHRQQAASEATAIFFFFLFFSLSSSLPVSNDLIMYKGQILSQCVSRQ